MTIRTVRVVTLALATAGCAGTVSQVAERNPQHDTRPQPAASAEPAVIDLTHSFDKHTIYAPGTKSGFRLRRLYHGVNELGFFHSANAISAPEHGGTHMSAPIHFAYGAATVDAVPLSRLIGPAVVIDMCAAASADADAQLAPADVERYERTSGPIEPNSIVVVRTCWSSRWPSRERYLGETASDASQQHFPGISESAAVMLVERNVAAIAIDTASVDHGPSVDFVTHRVFAAADVPVLVNLANLDCLPLRGAQVVALPMKIAGGAGSPLRVVAMLPGDVPGGRARCSDDSRVTDVGK